MSDAIPESGDRRLVDAFLARRREADFVVLYRRHTPALYRSALRFTGGRAEDADEVVQETWSRALGGLAAFRWDSALRTWLTGIALRCAQELARRSKRDQASLPLDEQAPDIEPAPGPFDEATVRGVEEAIARLPDGYRRVLVLHDVEGWTHEAIARSQGIAPGTSKSQLSRARRLLRTWFERDRQSKHGREL